MKGATFTEWFMATANRYLAQSTEKGAWPTVFAATAENASHGGYYGPQGFLSLFGAVGPNRTHRRSRDPEAMRRLWDVSMELTGVAYDGLDA